MTQDNAKIIDKIRKLMEMTTEAGCTPAEAEAATARVAALMATYQIGANDIAPEELRNKRGEVTPKYKKIEPWTLALAGAVAQMTGCFMAFSSYSSRIYFYGSEDAVDAAVYAFNNLQEQAARMAFDYWKKVKNETPEYMRGRIIRDYRSGVVTGIRNAIYEQQRSQRFEAENTTALVVVNNSVKKAEEWARSVTAFGKGRSRGSSVGDWSAYENGKADGSKVQRQPRLG